MNQKDVRLSRLRDLLAEHGGRRVALSARIKKSAVQISQWLSGYRTITEETARSIEKAAGLPPGWMDVAEGMPSSGAVAHDMSHRIDTLLPPIMGEQEVLTAKDLPPLFQTLVDDDSGGAAYPAGSLIIWSRTRTAKIGSIVLVRDSHNRMHIRQMQQGRQPGAWVAAPLHPAFAAFDSDADGLQVLAVFNGHQLPPE